MQNTLKLEEPPMAPEVGFKIDISKNFPVLAVFFPTFSLPGGKWPMKKEGGRNAPLVE